MTDRSIEQEITALVATYIDSIDAADSSLAATVWATTEGVSFIHPRGTEHGWQEIVDNFYGNTMRATFTKRTLRRVSDLDVKVYGDTAVAVFQWDFVAIRRDNGETLHTTGRESQVFAHIPGQGWRLIHVHYSGPPKTGIGEGF